MSIIKYLLLIPFLTGCQLFCKSIPNLPEHRMQVKTMIQGTCLAESFDITNEFIGFRGDVTERPFDECRQISGFSLETWEEMEAYLKAVFDTHEIPKSKLNLTNSLTKEIP